MAHSGALCTLTALYTLTAGWLMRLVIVCCCRMSNSFNDNIKFDDFKADTHESIQKVTVLFRRKPYC